MNLPISTQNVKSLGTVILKTRKRSEQIENQQVFLSKQEDWSHRENSHPSSPRASLVVQLVKNLPAMQETWVWSLGWEDPLEKGKATHSSILAWRIQSMGSQSQTQLSDIHSLHSRKKLRLVNTENHGIQHTRSRSHCWNQQLVVTLK